MTSSPPPADGASYQAYQAARRQELWGLLGDLPEVRPPAARLLRTTRHEGYTLEHLDPTT